MRHAPEGLDVGLQELRLERRHQPSTARRYGSLILFLPWHIERCSSTIRNICASSFLSLLLWSSLVGFKGFTAIKPVCCRSGKMGTFISSPTTGGARSLSAVQPLPGICTRGINSARRVWVRPIPPATALLSPCVWCFLPDPPFYCPILLTDWSARGSPALCWRLIVFPKQVPSTG